MWDSMSTSQMFPFPFPGVSGGASSGTSAPYPTSPSSKEWSGFSDRWTTDKGWSAPHQLGIGLDSDCGHQVPACPPSQVGQSVCNLGCKVSKTDWLEVLCPTKGWGGGLIYDPPQIQTPLPFLFKIIIILPQVGTRKPSKADVKIFFPTSSLVTPGGLRNSHALGATAWEDKWMKGLDAPRKPRWRWHSTHLLWVSSRGVLIIARTQFQFKQ